MNQWSFYQSFNANSPPARTQSRPPVLKTSWRRFRFHLRPMTANTNFSNSCCLRIVFWQSAMSSNANSTDRRRAAAHCLRVPHWKATCYRIHILSMVGHAACGQHSTYAMRRRNCETNSFFSFSRLDDSFRAGCLRRARHHYVQCRFCLLSSWCVSPVSSKKIPRSL